MGSLMGRHKETAFQKWSYHAAPEWFSVLQELAQLDDIPEDYSEGEFLEILDIQHIRALAKQARMALEAPNLAGQPPYPWRTTKLV